MMEKLENKFDKNMIRLIIFNLYVLLSLISFGIIHTIFVDFMNPITIRNIELSEIQQSLIIGLVIGIFSTFYLLKFYKIISKHFNHKGETS